MVYFTLGMWIFRALPYEQILAELLRDAPGLGPPLAPQASAAAIGRARRRLGVEPLRLLFEQAARLPAAAPGPADFHGLRPLRLCELDVGVPATPANLHGFAGAPPAALVQLPGLPTARPGRARELHARMRLLVEHGSRRITAAEVAAVPAPAPDRLPAGAVRPGDLLIMDERPLCARLWTTVENLGAQQLWPLTDQVHACSGSRLPDGSVLGKVAAEDGSELVARLLGPSPEHPVRLATSILDHRAAPADELAALYDGPGAAASVFDGIGASGGAEQLELRSKDPEMVRQELYAMLCVQHAIGDLVGSDSLATRVRRGPAPGPGGGDSRPSKVSSANSWPSNFACAQIRITHSPESGTPVNITVPPHGQCGGINPQA